MSTTVNDGESVTKDPDASRVFTWNWDADLASGASIDTSTWVITGPDSGLTSDNASKASRTTSVRLSGGTVGKTYTVTNRIVTDTSPAETEDASITVLIRQQ